MLAEQSLSKIALLRSLIEANQARIKKFIGQRSGDVLLSQTSIEDLYQETVCAALKSAGSYEHLSNSKFLGWICVIASRVISRLTPGKSSRSNRVLRISGRRSEMDGVTESSIPDRGRSPSSIASAQERRLTLREALATLLPRHREVLTLYKIEERSLSEVANHFNLTKNATARLIERALISLRQNLNP